MLRWSWTQEYMLNEAVRNEVNSLAPWRCGSNCRIVISEHVLQVKFMSAIAYSPQYVKFVRPAWCTLICISYPLPNSLLSLSWKKFACICKNFGVKSNVIVITKLYFMTATQMNWMSGCLDPICINYSITLWFYKAFVSKCPINNMSAWSQVKAWCR